MKKAAVQRTTAGQYGAVEFLALQPKHTAICQNKKEKGLSPYLWVTDGRQALSLL